MHTLPMIHRHLVLLENHYSNKILLARLRFTFHTNGVQNYRNNYLHRNLSEFNRMYYLIPNDSLTP